MIVRPARLQDGAAIRALILEMGGHEAIATRIDPMRGLSEVLACPDSRALVAEIDGRIVGYADLHARAAAVDDRREAWIGGLCVATSERRSGIAQALITEVDRAAALLGCTMLVLESSSWREDAHAFYRAQGFKEKAPARRFIRPILSEGDALEERFLVAAGHAAAGVRAAIVGHDGMPAVGTGADGAATEAADLAAESAALEELGRLELPIVSEESGLIGCDDIDPEQPWISLDPLDGSRNFVAGYRSYATAIALIRGGRPLAGFVCDLDSGHRWWAVAGGGAWRDGVRFRRRGGSTLVGFPSPSHDHSTVRPFTPGPIMKFERVRISGSTALDLVRVAEGSLGAFVCLDRPVVHMHDLAGPLAIILEAGATVIDATGSVPEIVPDPAQTVYVVAAADEASALALMPATTAI